MSHLRKCTALARKCCHEDGRHNFCARRYCKIIERESRGGSESNRGRNRDRDRKRDMDRTWARDRESKRERARTSVDASVCERNGDYRCEEGRAREKEIVSVCVWRGVCKWMDLRTQAHRNTLQNAAAPQRIATHCNTLQQRKERANRWRKKQKTFAGKRGERTNKKHSFSLLNCRSLSFSLSINSSLSLLNSIPNKPVSRYINSSLSLFSLSMASFSLLTLSLLVCLSL